MKTTKKTLIHLFAIASLVLIRSTECMDFSAPSIFGGINILNTIPERLHSPLLEDCSKATIQGIINIVPNTPLRAAINHPGLMRQTNQLGFKILETDMLMNVTISIENQPSVTPANILNALKSVMTKKAIFILNQRIYLILQSIQNTYSSTTPAKQHVLAQAKTSIAQESPIALQNFLKLLNEYIEGLTVTIEHKPKLTNIPLKNLQLMQKDNLTFCLKNFYQIKGCTLLLSLKPGQTPHNTIAIPGIYSEPFNMDHYTLCVMNQSNPQTLLKAGTINTARTAINYIPNQFVTESFSPRTPGYLPVRKTSSLITGFRKNG